MSNGVDRRQFVTGAIASAAAVATAGISRTSKGCPLHYDEYGQEVEWWCIVDVVFQFEEFWVYLWENCRTGQTLEQWDQPGLGPGDCNYADKDQSCVQGRVINSYKRVDLGGRVMVVSPDRSEEVRKFIHKNRSQIEARLSRR